MSEYISIRDWGGGEGRGERGERGEKGREGGDRGKGRGGEGRLDVSAAVLGLVLP